MRAPGENSFLFRGWDEEHTLCCQSCQPLLIDLCSKESLKLLIAVFCLCVFLWCELTAGRDEDGSAEGREQCGLLSRSMCEQK